MGLFSASQYIHASGLIHNDPKLFSLVDPNSGTSSNIDVMDIQIDNVHHSVGGGLQAHNYWDNEEEFVARLASIAQTMVKRQRPVTV